MKTLSFSNYDWLIREGEVGTIFSCIYNPDGATIFNRKKVKLALPKVDGKFQSAGIIGPEFGLGEYELEITARLDGLDPRVNFAFWFHNENTRDEVDIVEAFRWGDPNQPHIFWVTHWENAVYYSRESFPARGFSRYKFYANLKQDAVAIRAFGQLVDGEWKEVYQSYKPSRNFGFRPKIALWIPKDGLTTWKTATLIGPTYVILDSFKFTPAVTK